MKEIKIRDDICINYFEIQDGEAIILQVNTPKGVTDEIILLRPIALEIARMINKIMGEKMKKRQTSKAQKLPDLNKKKKLKSLPNKPIPLGGGPFVGRHTTG